MLYHQQRSQFAHHLMILPQFLHCVAHKCSNVQDECNSFNFRVSDSWSLQQPCEQVPAILKTEKVLSCDTSEHLFTALQESKEKLWIYRYWKLIASNSLFCCFNKVNQTPFLSTQSVRRSTHQVSENNYVSLSIKRCCIHQALHCYNHNDVRGLHGINFYVPLHTYSCFLQTLLHGSSH